MYDDDYETQCQKYGCMWVKENGKNVCRVCGKLKGRK